VAERRAAAVDRRALGRLTLLNAVVLAAYFVAFAVVARRGDPLLTQMIVYTLLVWGQVASGLAQRQGVQWRPSRARWPLLAGGIALFVVAFAVLVAAGLNPDLPFLFALIPAGLVLCGFGGYGISQLVSAARAGDQRPSRSAPVPLSLPARWGTVLVGVSMAILCLLSTAPDDVLRGVLVLLMAMLLLTWIAAYRSDIGLPAVGASWRWPHLLAFGVAAGVLVWSATRGPDALGAGMIGGLVVLVLFIGVALVPGAGRRG
jgi:hypothetical protein